MKHQSYKYNVGDFVYLNNKNIESIYQSKKLDWKFYRPYKMIEPVDKQAYKLKLLQTIKIHNVFHVSPLELYDGTHKDNTLPPLSINIESEVKYKVKKILNSKSHYGKLQYFVKWIDYLHLKN